MFNNRPKFLDKNPEYSPTETPRHTARRLLIERSVGLAVTIFIFAFVLLLVPLTMLLPTSFSLGENVIQIDWNMLDNIISLATFSLVVGGVFFVYGEVRSEVQRKREESESSFRFYKEVYERLMNPDSLEARRWVILNLPTLEDKNNDLDAWFESFNSTVHGTSRRSKNVRSPGQEYIKHILNDFDFIGFVHTNYWRIEGELAEWINPPVAKVWERIKWYVEKEAQLRNEPDYYAAARKFGDYCLDWRVANRPRANVIKNGI
jgi:hypothetical protein